MYNFLYRPKITGKDVWEIMAFLNVGKHVIILWIKIIITDSILMLFCHVFKSLKRSNFVTANLNSIIPRTKDQVRIVGGINLTNIFCSAKSLIIRYVKATKRLWPCDTHSNIKGQVWDKLTCARLQFTYTRFAFICESKRWPRQNRSTR